jgi:hypothetical protein
MPKLIVGLLVCVALAAAGLAGAGAAPVDYLSALIALAALVVSLLAAFKDDIFPFRLKVLMDEVALAAPGPTGRLSPSVLLPLVFVNEGHGSAVIEGLTLKIESASGTKVYTPVAEIDYVKFITGKRLIHAENMLGAFNLFPVGSRATVKKNILFTQEHESKRYPFADWSPGNHVFRLYAKHTGSDAVVETCCSTLSITKELLANYQSGTSASLSPGRELDA